MASFPILHQKVKGGGNSSAFPFKVFSINEAAVTVTQIPSVIPVPADKAEQIFSACSEWESGRASADITIKCNISGTILYVKATQIRTTGSGFELMGIIPYNSAKVYLYITDDPEISGKITL